MEGFDLPQEASSLRSLQSGTPSHFRDWSMHMPLVHWKWWGPQVAAEEENTRCDTSEHVADRRPDHRLLRPFHTYEVEDIPFRLLRLCTRALRCISGHFAGRCRRHTWTDHRCTRAEHCSSLRRMSRSSRARRRRLWKWARTSSCRDIWIRHWHRRVVLKRQNPTVSVRLDAGSGTEKQLQTKSPEVVRQWQNSLNDAEAANSSTAKTNYCFWKEHKYSQKNRTRRRRIQQEDASLLLAEESDNTQYLRPIYYYYYKTPADKNFSSTWKKSESVLVTLAQSEN